MKNIKTLFLTFTSIMVLLFVACDNAVYLSPVQNVELANSRIFSATVKNGETGTADYVFSNSYGKYEIAYVDTKTLSTDTEILSNEVKTASIELLLGNLHSAVPLKVTYELSDESGFIGTPIFEGFDSGETVRITAQKPTLIITVPLESTNQNSEETGVLTLKFTDETGRVYDIGNSTTEIPISIVRNQAASTRNFTATIEGSETDYYFYGADHNYELEYNDITENSSIEVKTVSIDLSLGNLKTNAAIKIYYELSGDIDFIGKPEFGGFASDSVVRIGAGQPTVRITLPLASNPDTDQTEILTLKFTDVSGTTYDMENSPSEIQIAIKRYKYGTESNNPIKFSATMKGDELKDSKLTYTDVDDTSSKETKTTSIELTLANIHPDAPITVTFAPTNSMDGFIGAIAPITLTATEPTKQIAILLASNPDIEQSGTIAVTFSAENGFYATESLDNKIEISVTRKQVANTRELSTSVTSESTTEYDFTYSNGKYEIKYKFEEKTSSETAKTASITLALGNIHPDAPITVNFDAENATNSPSFIGVIESIVLTKDNPAKQITIPLASNPDIEQTGTLVVKFSDKNGRIYNAGSLDKDIEISIVRDPAANARTFTADIEGVGTDYLFSGSDGKYVIEYTDGTEASSEKAKTALIELALDGLKDGHPVTVEYATTNSSFIDVSKIVTTTLSDGKPVQIKVPLASNPAIDQNGILTVTFSDKDGRIYSADSLAKEIKIDVTRNKGTAVSGVLTVTAKYLKNVSMTDTWGDHGNADGIDKPEFVYSVRSRSYSGDIANEWDALSSFSPNSTSTTPSNAKTIQKGTTLDLGNSTQYPFKDITNGLSLELDSRIVEIDTGAREWLTDYEKPIIRFAYDRYIEKWAIVGSSDVKVEYDSNFTIGIGETKDFVITIKGMELCYTIAWESTADPLPLRKFTASVAKNGEDTAYTVSSPSNGNYDINYTDATEESSALEQTIAIDLVVANLRTDAPIKVVYATSNSSFITAPSSVEVSAENPIARIEITLATNSDSEQLGTLTVKFSDENDIYDMIDSPSQIGIAIKRDQIQSNRSFSATVAEKLAGSYTVNPVEAGKYAITSSISSVSVDLSLVHLRSGAPITVTYITNNNFITAPTVDTVITAENSTVPISISLAEALDSEQTGTLTLNFSAEPENAYNAESLSQTIEFDITREKKPEEPIPLAELTLDFTASTGNPSNFTFVSDTITDTTGAGFTATFDLAINVASTHEGGKIPEGNSDILVQIGDYTKDTGGSDFLQMYFGTDPNSKSFTYTPEATPKKLTIVYDKSFGVQEGSFPITFTGIDLNVYEATIPNLRLEVVSNKGTPSSVAIKELTDNKADVTVSDVNTNYTLAIKDSSITTASDKTYAIDLTLDLDGVLGDDYPLTVILSNGENLAISDVERNNGRITFTATHTGVNQFQSTNGGSASITIDSEQTVDGYEVYSGLPITIDINTVREHSFAQYVDDYAKEFAVSTSTENLYDEVEKKYYTVVTIPGMKDADTGNLSYEILRKDDRSTTDFKSLATKTLDASEEFVEKDYNAFILRTEPQYKITVSHEGCTDDSCSSEVVKSGSRMLTNRELFLAAMDSIRYALIDGGLHDMPLSGVIWDPKNETVYDEDDNSFLHNRTYNSGSITYNHTYTPNNYKPYFVTLTDGNFHYTNSNNDRNSIDTYYYKDNWLIPDTYKGSPFKGTVNFTSSYGRGSIKFNDIKNDDNSKNDPNWNSGNFIVTIDGNEVTYNNGEVPFGFYMNSAKFLEVMNAANYTQK